MGTDFDCYARDTRLRARTHMMRLRREGAALRTQHGGTRGAPSFFVMSISAASLRVLYAAGRRGRCYHKVCVSLLEMRPIERCICALWQQPRCEASPVVDALIKSTAHESGCT